MDDKPSLTFFTRKIRYLKHLLFVADDPDAKITITDEKGTRPPDSRDDAPNQPERWHVVNVKRSRPWFGRM